MTKFWQILKGDQSRRNLPEKSLVPSRFEFPMEDYAGNSKLDGTKDISGGFLRMIFL